MKDNGLYNTFLAAIVVTNVWAAQDEIFASSIWLVFSLFLLFTLRPIRLRSRDYKRNP